MTPRAKVRAAIKAVAESVLVRAGPAALSRRAFRRRALVLAYHNILPDEIAPLGDRSLHLPRARFVEQLEELKQHCEVVSLDEAIGSTWAPAADRPRVAITFDDAYRGAVTIGVAELVRRGFPATLFVAPAFIGGRSFWWDALGESLTGGLPESVRRAALEGCQGIDSSVRRWAQEHSIAVRDLPPDACAASEEELLAASRAPGITLGAHTWSHPNLPLLSPQDLRFELERPLAWMRERVPNHSPWLSYPYGLWSPATAVAARAAGYRGGLLVSGGWLPPDPKDPFAFPRLNIPADLSREGFLLRMAGLLCR